MVKGNWRTFSKKECEYRYRESMFKALPSVLLWETTLTLPSRPQAEIMAEVERLLQKRIATQPHLKTAGSCFKATSDGTPAWQWIDKAGLRGQKVGEIQISEKHANFLLNTDRGSFVDLVALTKKIRAAVPAIVGIEMRLYGEDGKIVAA